MPKSITDPFEPLDGISSTNYLGEYVDPEFTTSGTSSGTSSSSPIVVASNSSTTTTTASTTTTTPSLATSPIVANTSLPISLVPGGMAGGGTGAGNSTENPQASNGGAKESLLDKLKKLPDWKKGLIILAIAAGSYYGYKQLK